MGRNPGRITKWSRVWHKTNHAVEAAEGDGHLEWLTIKNIKTQQTERVRADGLFAFIGATPRTDWLGDSVARHEQGFILSGPDLKQSGRFGHNWPLKRDPYMLETSKPGVFVAGDVRKGSIKRTSNLRQFATDDAEKKWIAPSGLELFSQRADNARCSTGYQRSSRWCAVEY